MIEQQYTICRACHAGCSVIVDIDVDEGADTKTGTPIAVKGNIDDPLFKGFCCIKGQHFHSTRNSPQRLLHSQKRMPDGSYQSIPVNQAMDEIAAKLLALLAKRGPRTIASYSGTMAANTGAVNSAMSSAWLKATGSRMGFNSNTIDQPGKMVAAALHGKWMAPSHNFSQADVIMLIGVNPLIAMSGGIPHTNPGRTLTDAINKGLKLIVVDPRRTETARRANLHLQVKPGHDVELLAAMLNIIISERWYDEDFVTEHVDHLANLKAAVEPFTVQKVAPLLDIAGDDIISAARMFAQGEAGVVTAGTGPNMSGHTTLLEYLVLNLNTLCGRWQRAGEAVVEPATLGLPTVAKAQAMPPYPDYAYGFGNSIRTRGLGNTAAGLPTAALADEILLPGEQQIKALVVHGGNPVAAWPDQQKTIAAMNALELLVQIDITMSATAKMADYVIAVKHPLECVGSSLAQEYLSGYAVGFGTTAPHANYTPALVDAPADSDVIEDWEFFYGLSQRMNLELKMKPISFSGTVQVPGHKIDMINKPTTDQLLELLTEGSRVPLSKVKAQRGGALFPEPAVIVTEKDQGWTSKLDVGNAQMMTDLIELSARLNSTIETSDAIQTSDTIKTNDTNHLGKENLFHLISRRQINVLNSTGQTIPAQLHGKHYNAAFMHPLDLADQQLSKGDTIKISSDHASIIGIVDCDKNLRRGLISMTHCWGDQPKHDDKVKSIGSNTGRLSSVERNYEKYTGLPRMSNIPVTIASYDIG